MEPQTATPTNQDDITPESLTHLKDAHQAFVDFLKQNSRSTSTILAYGKDIEQLMEYALNMHQIEHVHLITPDHLNDYKQELHSQKYTAKSISRKINSIKSFFRYLKNHGHINSNPADHVTHPKYENKSPRILSKTEYRALRDACRDDIRTSAIVEVLLQTGIRIGELANLTIENVKKDHLVVEAYESQPSREVPLNKTARTAIDQWLKDRPANAKTKQARD